ncbi:MAG: hypothetical protein ABIQ40_18480 [Bacteroidia bacterium]
MSNYNLEIHHISVSAGDATVIAGREDINVKKPDCLILIDAGRYSTDMTMITDHCIKCFGTAVFTHIIISHFHEDHQGTLVSTESIKKVASDDTCIYYPNTIKGGLSYSFGKHFPIEFDVDTNMEIKILNDKAVLTCYCAGSVPRVSGYTDTRLDSFKKSQKSKLKSFKNFRSNLKIKDENDLSLAWVLTYVTRQKKEDETDYSEKDYTFRYFSAGDLSGHTEGKYTNIEGPLLDCLAKVLNGSRIEVIKATHHGSRHSMYGKNKGALKNSESPFLEKLAPKTIIVPCNQDHLLPMHEFFDRAFKYNVEEVFMVNEFSRGTDKYIDPLVLDNNQKKYWFEKSGRTTTAKRSNIELVEEKMKEEILSSQYLYDKRPGIDDKPFLPVCVVGISAGTKGAGYDIIHSTVAYSRTMVKNKGLDSAKYPDIPMKIPKYFLLRPREESYIAKLLGAEIVKNKVADFISHYVTDDEDEDYTFSTDMSFKEADKAPLDIRKEFENANKALYLTGFLDSFKFDRRQSSKEYFDGEFKKYLHNLKTLSGTELTLLYKDLNKRKKLK